MSIGETGALLTLFKIKAYAAAHIHLAQLPQLKQPTLSRLVNYTSCLSSLLFHVTQITMAVMGAVKT